MTKTRSQAGNIAIKKEEEEEDCKSTLLLHSVNSTSSNNRIAKRTTPKNRKSRLPAQDIKVEEDTDTKSLLQPSPKYSRLLKGQCVSQEQINRFIDYVVNDKMDAYTASYKAKISYNTANYYYNVYKSDPEKEIPSPRSRLMYLSRVYTQEHIENLIRYITKDKLNVKEASAKANMTYHSGYRYYVRYLKDPDHNIPIPHSKQRCTLDQRNVFISYIVNDKMSLRAASKKNKNECQKYLKNQN